MGQGSRDRTLKPVSQGTIRAPLSCEDMRNEALDLGMSIEGELDMSGNKMDKHGERVAATELIEQYRPLGLKAVLAAAMQVKPKPAKKPAPHMQMAVPKPSA